MNKSLIISAVGLLLLTSCGKETDMYEANKEIVDQANAEEVFGVKFNPNQDWCTTVSGQVNVQADASVKKVQLLVDAMVIDEDATATEYSTRSALKLINQAETNGRTSLTLHYDAPENNRGLYVAFITNDNGYFLTKVENGTASMNSSRTRADESEVLTTGYTLPSADNIYVAGSETSWAGQEPQNWRPGEQLYYLNDYDGIKVTGGASDYSNDFKAFFKTYLDNYLPNGRKNDNSWRVYSSEAYNSNCYYVTKENEPVILTPAYKYDHPTEYGFEVYRSELYYYYYKDSEVTGDIVTFLQSLPKYKAIPFNQVFGAEEDATVTKHGSYALPFFETGSSTKVADANTKCSFKWPAGYKIGFMIKANTDADGGKKRGEVYGDGRLNNKINFWGNFRSSHLGKDGPRLLWVSFNNRIFMSWESGTDADFNDIFIEIEGGTVIPNVPEPDLEWFTYCFEDTERGDYDMNDLVIKATRIDETTVEYRIVACGAYDDISAMGINSGVIQDGKEVHDLFEVSNHKTFINTDGSNYGYISCTKTVDAEFSFLTAKDQPYLKDLTTGVEVKLAGKGQNPHGILIPTDFKYPTEKSPITESYPLFNEWGVNDSYLSTLWYTAPVAARVR